MSGRRRDVMWLVRSAPGRLELRRRYSRKLWPLTSRIARLYRRTVARRTTLVVVVGSVGKTTTMRAVSTTLGLPIGALAGSNSHSAVAGALLGIRPWQRRAVVEVGIGGPGEMRDYAGTTRPDVTVVTAIATDHWPTLLTLQRTRDEKAEMVRALAPSGTAVLNADDPHVRWMASQTRARVIWYGFSSEADVRATDYELDWPHGTRFTVLAAARAVPVHIRLVGRHMIYPALAALAVALAEGVPLDVAIAAIEELAPGDGKMQPVILANGGIVLQDDAKGTVATYHAALDALSSIPARRKAVVFGGIRQPPLPEDATYRDLGRRVASLADRAIFVGNRFDDYRFGHWRAAWPRTRSCTQRTRSRRSGCCATPWLPTRLCSSRGSGNSASGGSAWRCQVRTFNVVSIRARSSARCALSAHI